MSDVDVDVAATVVDSLARASSCSSGDFSSAGSLSDLAQSWLSPLAATAVETARAAQPAVEYDPGAHTLSGAGAASLSALLRRALAAVPGVELPPYAVPPAHWYVSLASLANDRLAREHETASAEMSLLLVRNMAEGNQQARRRIRHERDMSVSVLAALMGLPHASDAADVVAAPRTAAVPAATLRAVLSPLLPSAAPELDPASATADRQFAAAVASIALDRPRDVHKVILRFLFHSMRLLPHPRPWTPAAAAAAASAAAEAEASPLPPPYSPHSAVGGALSRARGLLAVVESASASDAGVVALDVVRKLAKVAGNHSSGAKLSALAAALSHLHGYSLQALQTAAGGADGSDAAAGAAERDGGSKAGAAVTPAVRASAEGGPAEPPQLLLLPVDLSRAMARAAVADFSAASLLFARCLLRKYPWLTAVKSRAATKAAAATSAVGASAPRDGGGAAAPASGGGDAAAASSPPSRSSRGGAASARESGGPAAASGGSGAAPPLPPAPPPPATTPVDFSRLVLNVTREALSNLLHAPLIAAYLQAEREEEDAWTRVRRGGGAGRRARHAAMLLQPPLCSRPLAGSSRLVACPAVCVLRGARLLRHWRARLHAHAVADTPRRLAPRSGLPRHGRLLRLPGPARGVSRAPLVKGICARRGRPPHDPSPAHAPRQGLGAALRPPLPRRRRARGERSRARCARPSFARVPPGGRQGWRRRAHGPQHRRRRPHPAPLLPARARGRGRAGAAGAPPPANGAA